jgi:hypothetical protein
MALYDDCKTNEGNESYTDQLIRRKRLGDALSRATTYILNTLGTELEKEIRVYAFGGESGRNWMNSGEVGKAIAAQILNDGEKLYYEIIPQDLKLKSAQIPSSIDDMNDQITKISEVYHKRHDEAWKKYSRFSDQTRTDLGYDAVKEELYEIVRTVEKFEFTKEYRDAKARLAAIDEHARTITDPYYDEHIGKLDAERNQKIQAINKAMNQIVPDIFNPVIDSIIESSGISKEEADAWARNHGKVLYVAKEEGLDKTLQDKLNDKEVKHQNLYVASALPDSLSYYDFIFLDSVNKLGLQPEELNRLKAMYPQKAFIYIFQTTKDGRFRGANTFQHDVDSVIEVPERGKAVQFGRFNQGGELDIF